MDWGNRLVPTVDPHGSAELVARKFDIAMLQPVVARQVSDLGGLLDANMKIQLQEQAPHVEGTASLQKGVLQLPQIGQRFSDIKANVDVAGNEIRLERLEAHGISGKLTANASAALQGTELQAAKLELAIAKDDKLPVTLEGAALGDAWGKVRASYTKARDGSNDIVVDIPSFHLLMPDAASASVQNLEPAEYVRVGVYRKDKEFVTLPVQPLEDKSAESAPEEPPTITRIHVKLGSDVALQKGHQVNAQLTGQINVVSGSETQITGEIHLSGGKLDVSGKTFEIERGVVSLAGADPSNPTITATARWDSPAGYSVYADYAGTAKKGKLNLHSDPPLTQDQIISLLMFGSPDGSFGSSGSGQGSNDTAATAVGVAGGTAAQGLNRVLSDITDFDVSARIDTSTGSSRPELVMQLTPRVAAKLTRAIGTPAPGQPPDLTFLTLEFRIRRAWSLSAIVGDHGSSTLDLIWRKRY
jgi:translocation and assembly module TamB